jgi:hypothetical protein
VYKCHSYPKMSFDVFRDDHDTALDGGADVGPVNLWMHSLISDVNVSLNDKLVSPPTSLYPISCIRMSWGVQVPFLSENVIRCVPLLGLFSLGRSLYSSFSWGSYRVHNFLE